MIALSALLGWSISMGMDTMRQIVVPSQAEFFSSPGKVNIFAMTALLVLVADLTMFARIWRKLDQNEGGAARVNSGLRPSA